MAPTVWLAADTLGYPTGGGHFWAYLNWALGLAGIGCEVVWLERWSEAAVPARLAERLTEFGLHRLCLVGGPDRHGSDIERLVAFEEAESAELLLNLAYDLPASVVGRFKRAALLDIDPGMTQSWVAAGHVALAPHDVYLTTGEGIANRTSPVPDCGIRWLYTAPCAALEHWVAEPAPERGAYTTVTHWWGDSSFVMPDGRVIDNSKRASFLPYLPVARRAGVGLELAVAADDLEDDAPALTDHGWSVADPVRVGGTPERYRAYVGASRGEFSCAKPAYAALATGWISDRTVCYLASGRPVVIQDTGPSALLDAAEGKGVFRFRDLDSAVAALTTVERDYAAQCQQARAFAEQHLDARERAAQILELCLT